MRNTSTSSTSSVASSRSSKSSLRPSNSTQGLKTVAEGGYEDRPVPNKRSPSSSDIDFRRRFTSDSLHNQQNQLAKTTSSTPLNENSPVPNTLKGEYKTSLSSSSTPYTPSKKNKKEVTSRIADLWKKVEDSKKKKEKEKGNDKRVWIAKGKVIPESERALLRPHAEQQAIIDNFQKSTKQREQLQNQQEIQTHNDSMASNTSPASNSNNNTKVRSRSRLSIKLSKFSRSSSLSSNKREKSKGLPSTIAIARTPTAPNTAPLATFDASLTSTEEDRLNGNSSQEIQNGEIITTSGTRIPQTFLPRHLYSKKMIR